MSHSGVALAPCSKEEEKMTKLPEIPIPTRPNCFIQSIAHSETDFAIYLYMGIPDIIEQSVATLGSVEKRGEHYYIHGSDVAYDTLDQAGMALFERWKRPKKKSR